MRPEKDHRYSKILVLWVDCEDNTQIRVEELKYDSFENKSKQVKKKK